MESTIKLVRGTLLFVITTMALGAQAADMNLRPCAFGPAPSIADGKTASQEQMTATATAVRSYMGTMQDALACLEDAEKKLGADITDEQKLKITAAYNSGVDKLNNVASAYNEQVRAFKNR